MEQHAPEIATTFRDLAFLIPLLPLAAFFAIVFLGKRSPGKGHAIGIAAVGTAFVLGVLNLVEAIRATSAHAAIVEKSLTWFELGSIHLEFGMRVDTLASMMFVVVTFVSLLVQIYSTGYMHGDVRYTWYFAVLNLFTGAMLNLVIANNLVQLLIGWELVGICSYLLIGHWFEEKDNSSAAIKAFLTTKTGDLGFYVGIFVVFLGAGTFNIGEIAERVPQMSSLVVTVGAILLFVGAVGKSAQFPLHVWLPDAMAGPTPVSALIHAATMVTAGVYLVARIFQLFSASQPAMNTIGVIAAITMLFAAILAVVQRDIKKVLAYSTISQLGYMMAALAIGAAGAGVFHLFTHAFFKALLFLGAGSVIHAVHSNDMFAMGGLRRFMPTTYATFLIGSAALAGVPPLAGFWSKDEILAAAYEQFGHLHGSGRTVALIVLLSAMATAFLTAFYMTRTCVLTFFGDYRRMPVAGGAGGHDHEDHGLPHESPPSMAYPLIALAVLSVVAGLVGTPVKNLFAEWIHIEGAFHGHFQPGIAVASIVLALGGIALGWVLYSGRRFGFSIKDPIERFGGFWRAAERRFFIDDIYLKGIVRPVQYGLSKFVYERLDRGVIDKAVNGAGAGTVYAGRATRALDQGGVDAVVNGVASLIDRFSGALRHVQSGNVQRYAVWLFFGVFVLAAVLLR